MSDEEKLDLIGCGVNIGSRWSKQNTIEELEKIIDKIDFEEKWLINIKMDNGFISIADIEIAMSGIRRVVSELKGEDK